MAESLIVKNKLDGEIKLLDNGGANTYTVAFEAGDLTYNVPKETVNNYLDRGKITSPPSIRHGDDQVMTGSFTAYFRDSTDASVATLHDLLADGGWLNSNWVSTMGATGEVFTVTLQFTVLGDDEHGDGNDHVIQFPYAHISGSVAEGDPSTITINWTSYAVRPTIVS